MLFNLLYFFMTVVLGFYKCISQASTVNSPIYTAAVVEYHPVVDGIDGKEIAEANSNNYVTIIKIASTYNVDIIVFPEFGLTSLPKDGAREKRFSPMEYRNYFRNAASHVPSPEEGLVLCDADSKYAKSLRQISCGARDSKIYVVVNHQEKIECDPNSLSDCPPDGFLLYNSNIAFDREGRVIARYRKFNHFDELGTDVTPEPEYSMFHTDFGVTFGQFICFDVVHRRPTTYFAKNPNVTDVVYSTHWFAYPPFLQATEVQAAWAFAADVNFLASGYNDALTASGGSGIYAGKQGPIIMYLPMKTSNALIISEVPKRDYRRKSIKKLKPIIRLLNRTEVPTISGIPPRVDLFHNIKDDLLPYTSKVLDIEKSSLHATTLCDRGLCCDFHVETDYDAEAAAKPGAKQYRYRLVVFNGVANYVKVSTAGVELCALVACAGNTLQNCTEYYEDKNDVITPITFNSVVITRRANLDDPIFFLPTTLLLETYEPMSPAKFTYLTSGPRESSLQIMHLTKPQNRLAAFCLYGRRFDRDGQSETMPDDDEVEWNSPLVSLIGLLVIILVVGYTWYPRKVSVQKKEK